MANSDDRDGFGIIVTYVVKMRLFLGALAGELVGELPIILMHPKVSLIVDLKQAFKLQHFFIHQPNPKKLPKMDSVAYETFGTTSMDEGGEADKLNSVNE